MPLMKASVSCVSPPAAHTGVGMPAGNQYDRRVRQWPREP